MEDEADWDAKQPTVRSTAGASVDERSVMNDTRITIIDLDSLEAARAIPLVTITGSDRNAPITILQVTAAAASDSVLVVVGRFATAGASSVGELGAANNVSDATW